jgi:cell fate regulator YaaT (PSP1 superfamily)
MACTGCSSGADGKPAGCKSNGYCSSSGCNKLGVFDWLAGVPIAAGQQPFDGVEVRFKNTRKAFYRNTSGLQLMPGDLVTVDAAPGHDIGMVSLTGELVRAQMERRNVSGETYDLRKVLHKSTQEEIDRWHASRKLEDETMFAARQLVRDARLDMKVTDVEYQADGTKAVFYYVAEERIDFRGIIRSMSERFKVRVEMKQIGARQETGRIGGIGSCGRELCCSTWLTDFRSVTTSAARYQQLALNPQKLAGPMRQVEVLPELRAGHVHRGDQELSPPERQAEDPTRHRCAHEDGHLLREDVVRIQEAGRALHHGRFSGGSGARYPGPEQAGYRAGG